MSYHGDIHVSIFIHARLLLALFLDWYMLLIYFVIISLDLELEKMIIWLVSSNSGHDIIVLQVQSLPRMIIMDEIGKQVSFEWTLLDVLCLEESRVKRIAFC